MKVKAKKVVPAANSYRTLFLIARIVVIRESRPESYLQNFPELFLHTLQTRLHRVQIINLTRLSIDLDDSLLCFQLPWPLWLPHCCARATVSAKMASTALYTSLPDREGPEKENAEGEASESPLLDGDSLVFGKKRGSFRRYGCWIVYFGGILVTAGLLSGIQQSLRNDRCDCWDKFNYFCKRVFRQLIKLDELQRLKSPLQLTL